MDHDLLLRTASDTMAALARAGNEPGRRSCRLSARGCRRGSGAGWARARAAVSDLSALSEAAVDLHARTPATALGISVDAIGPIPIAEGERITALVRKGR
ncbi:hypothetical protein [Streptomyces sp. NPDC048256]|uniref:hypothetical protein n=1 Tax=Streptomyces sp. NPDC048256 TaxID=3154613 RepID=UPI0033E5596F